MKRGGRISLLLLAMIQPSLFALICIMSLGHNTQQEHLDFLLRRIQANNCGICAYATQLWNRYIYSIACYLS